MEQDLENMILGAAAMLGALCLTFWALGNFYLFLTQPLSSKRMRLLRTAVIALLALVAAGVVFATGGVIAVWILLGSIATACWIIRGFRTPPAPHNLDQGNNPGL